VRVTITGVAGFIGSTLAEALLARGDEVVGIDCFTPYYDRAMKDANLDGVRDSSRFTFVEADLRSMDIAPVVEGADVIFHQAAQAGVRLSWSHGFAEYDSCNVLATQRLLEAAVAAGTPRFVYASSSSVYGNASRYPTAEDDLPRPHSPYGVTKLAGEHLCGLYAANHGLSTVSLRYFTVYGPRQRPDMAIHRIIEAGLDGQPFTLLGDGSAVRDFTFVDDVVRANLRAGDADLVPGTVLNVAGGGEVTMSALLELAETVLGRPIAVDRKQPTAGDVARTGGTVAAAATQLGWRPSVEIAEGLARQADWHRARRA
jgi:nucleoside-diphosphate-sugar epimerase